MRGFIFALALRASGLVHAGPADDAAARAQEVHERRCASVAADHATLAAAAMAEVAGVWAEVEAIAADTAEPHLSYWTGLLAECLNRDEEAAQSLELFLAQTRDLPGYESMRQDAERRLTRGGRRSRRGTRRRSWPRPRPPGTSTAATTSPWAPRRPRASPDSGLR